VNISKWRWSELPDIDIGEDWSLKNLVRKVMRFKMEYESPGSEGCSGALYYQREVISIVDRLPEAWARVPIQFREPRETFFETAPMVYFGIHPRFCKDAPQKFEEVLKKMEPLRKLNLSQYKGTGWGNTPEWIQIFARALETFTSMYKVMDKTKCGRLWQLYNYLKEPHDIKEWVDMPDDIRRQCKEYGNYVAETRGYLRRLAGIK
jgi:hypothetical protein